MKDREEEQAPSEAVKRLRESFAPLAALLGPEDEPAFVYCAGPAE